ncbi:MAG: T9SS type A sorting domain-containing protein [Bacteroidota bacterium]
MKKNLASVLLISIIHFSAFNIKAQNLVPNGDFENYGVMPCGWTGSPADLANALIGWSSPTTGTPDAFSTLINSSCTNFLPHSTDPSSNGWQAPHSGNIFAGFYTEVDGTLYREYLQSQLAQPMVVGATYRVSMYVSLGDNSQYATNNMGIGFSDVITNTASYTNLGTIPEINFTNVISDTAGWTYLCDTIVATSAWQYIVIGDFYDDANTTLVNYNPGGYWSRCYYYCDDVEVEEIALAPVALFNAPHQICPGTCTDFTNLSLNGTSFVWTFTGATPSTSTDVNPTTICYNTPGNYSVSLIATNAIGSDTLTLNNFITVYPYPAAQGIIQSGDTLFAIQGSASYQWYLDGNLIPGATDYFYIAPQSGDYNVVCTDGNGCEVEAVIFDVIASTQNPIGGLEFAIFPNPVEGKMTIDSREMTIKAISIYNLLGEMVFKTAIPDSNARQQTEIDVRTLASGVYIVELAGAEKNFRSRFVKK